MDLEARKFKAIVIGASWGGIEALIRIASSLRPDFSIPIIIVQHQHPHSDSTLSWLLSRKTTLLVTEAEEKMPIQAGGIYLAPANYHLLVERDLSLSLCVSVPVHFSRPSIDVLFESASEAFGRELLGIILTGANQDGTFGLSKIKKRGGVAIAQDPSTAEVATMPQSAIDFVDLDAVYNIEEIINLLNKL